VSLASAYSCLSYSYTTASTLYEPVEPGSAAPSDEEEEVEEELAALDLSVLYSVISCPHANGICCIV